MVFRREGENGRSMVDRKTKRRYNLVYRLRKRGIMCDSRKRTIYLVFGTDTAEDRLCRQLCSEFRFAIQFILI